MKKLIAILLAVSIIFAVPCSAFASSVSSILPEPIPPLHLDTLRGLFVDIPLVFLCLPFAAYLMFFEDTWLIADDLDNYIKFIEHMSEKVPLPSFFDQSFPVTY